MSDKDVTVFKTEEENEKERISNLKKKNKQSLIAEKYLIMVLLVHLEF